MLYSVVSKVQSCIKWFNHKHETVVCQNGQLLIGTGSDGDFATLTAGEGIDVTNGSGSITIGAEVGTSSSI